MPGYSDKVWKNRIVRYGMVSPEQTLANENNWRTHPREQQAALADILDDVGWVQDVIVNVRSDESWNGDRNVETLLDGHARIILAMRHGNTEVPAKFVDLNPDEESLVLATLDELAGMATTDGDKLKALVERIKANTPAVQDVIDRLKAKAELAIEMARAAGEQVPDPGAQIDRAGELQEKWQVERGQIWEVGRHRVMCGDSTCAEDVGRLMGEEKTRAIVTDPPYGISWNTDHTRFSTQYGVRKKFAPIEGDKKLFDPRPYLDYDHVALFGANWYCRHIPLGTWIVWDKRHPNGTAWLSDAELCWVKGGTGIYIYAETVQGAHRRERAEHPTQKPVGVIVFVIDKARIGVGDAVFDPFLGSGTTLIACEQTSRTGYGMEIHPPYVSVSLERLSGMGLMPKLIS